MEALRIEGENCFVLSMVDEKYRLNKGNVSAYICRHKEDFLEDIHYIQIDKKMGYAIKRKIPTSRIAKSFTNGGTQRLLTKRGLELLANCFECERGLKNPFDGEPIEVIYSIDAVVNNEKKGTATGEVDKDKGLQNARCIAKKYIIKEIKNDLSKLEGGNEKECIEDIKGLLSELEGLEK